MKNKPQHVAVGFEILDWHKEGDTFVIDNIRLTEASYVTVPADPYCVFRRFTWWDKHGLKVMWAVWAILVLVAILVKL